MLSLCLKLYMCLEVERKEKNIWEDIMKKLVKIWMKSFGFKEYKYFDSYDEAAEFVENYRLACDDPCCCGICN